MKTIWNNFKVAFAMYSKIPMPPADWEKENMKYALCFFPWVGLAVGAVSAVLFWMLQQIGAGSMLRAAVLTAVPVLVTGGIHLDGYLDTMDALSSWREKQRRLEILKDPHAGAFAIIMGCLYFVLYAGAAGELVWKIFPAYAFGFAVSRSFSGLSIAFFPNANPYIMNRYTVCAERNSGSVWHERREKKNGGGACCDDFCRDGALGFVLRLGGTGCTGCVGTGILLL